MILRLLFIFVFSLRLDLAYSQEQIQQLPQSDSSIFISEELIVYLPITSSNINFSISASGKSAKESSSGLELIKKKIETFMVGSQVVVLNRSLSGGTGSGDSISATSPILIEEDISVVVNEDSLPKVIDYLITIPQVKLGNINPLKDNLFDLKTKMSSKVVKLAYQKASQIAKDQAMVLGDIIDLTITEEPTASSIRDQLDQSKNSSLSNPLEIKIVASLRIKLIMDKVH